jgi:hypothetical protein
MGLDMASDIFVIISWECITLRYASTSSLLAGASGPVCCAQPQAEKNEAQNQTQKTEW